MDRERSWLVLKMLLKEASGRLCGGSTHLLWSWTDRRDRQTCLVLLCLAVCWLLRSKSGCCSGPPFADSFLLALISSLYSVKVYSRWEKHDLVWEMWTTECEPCKDTAAHLKCKIGIKNLIKQSRPVFLHAAVLKLLTNELCIKDFSCPRVLGR